MHDQKATQNEGDEHQLTEEELIDFSQQLAQATRSNLPIAQGLRALHDDTSSSRLRRLLARIVARLDDGKSLEEVLTDRSSAFPPNFTGLVTAGLRSNNLGLLLERYIEDCERFRALRRKAWIALMYPALVFLTLLAVIVAVNSYYVPQVRQIYAEYGLQVPVAVVFIFYQAEVIASMRIPLFIGIGAAACAVIASSIFMVGQSIWRRVPFFGPQLRWSAVAESYSLLSLFVSQNFPVPTALHFATLSCRDRVLRTALASMRKDVEQGVELGNAAQMRIPKEGMGVLILWGESHGCLSNALEVAAEVAEQRAVTQSKIIDAIVPPIILLCIGIFLLFAVLAVFAPMTMLLHSFGTITLLARVG